MDEQFVHPRLVPLYDLACGWGEDREYYFSLAKDGIKTVLELGSGTGLISRKIASNGFETTAVDPSEAMLEFGKEQDYGDKVRWIKGTAQSFKDPSQFDYIFMTGHAFQVLLTDQDIAHAFRTISKHLTAGGLFAFETRNPRIDWKARWHGTELNIGAEKTVLQRTVCRAFEGDILEIEHSYVFPEETIVSKSKLRFPDQQRILELLAAAGLSVTALYGDWKQGPITRQSQEIIVQANLF